MFIVCIWWFLMLLVNFFSVGSMWVMFVLFVILVWCVVVFIVIMFGCV